MKTDDLIAALAAEARPAAMPPARRLLLLVLTGAGLALLLLLATLGVRPDWQAVLTAWRFEAKFVIFGAAALLAIAECLRLCRPTTARSAWYPLLFTGLLLAAAMLAELVLVPSESWSARALGRNALVCLTVIPLLALPPLAALLLALRGGAPVRPGNAGAMAGFAAASIAASFYALHCTDDSPLFVAIWYGLALALVSAAGAILGRRLLRW